MKYVFIEKYQAEFSVKAMCRVLRVARSAWYAWRLRRHQPGPRQQFRLICDVAVRQAFTEAKQRYGAPHLAGELPEYSIKTIAGGPNQKWAGNITYLRTDEGWLYLAVVIDLWSRAVIGWSMSPRMTAQLTCEVLQMALWQHKRPENVIVHIGRGGQYCSLDYQTVLKRHNQRGSISTKGCCYDNACVESFFHSLKVECIHGERFTNREIMQTTVFNYIECDYNRWRRHSACGDASPEQFENQNLA